MTQMTLAPSPLSQKGPTRRFTAQNSCLEKRVSQRTVFASSHTRTTLRNSACPEPALWTGNRSQPPFTCHFNLRGRRCTKLWWLQRLPAPRRRHLLYGIRTAAERCVEVEPPFVSTPH